MNNNITLSVCTYKDPRWMILMNDFTISKGLILHTHYFHTYKNIADRMLFISGLKYTHKYSYFLNSYMCTITDLCTLEEFDKYIKIVKSEYDDNDTLEYDSEKIITHFNNITVGSDKYFE